jgi:class 3 adenylate cyclase
MPEVTFDNEIKLISTANTQIKFYNKKPPADIVEKVEKLIRILGIEIVSPPNASKRSRARTDTYFDDGWKLANQSCVLHLRSDDRSDAQRPDALIFKFDESKVHTNGLEYLKRRELRVELTQQQVEDHLKRGISIAELKEYFPDAELDCDDGAQFRPEGTVRIKRSTVAVHVAGNLFRILFDRYYFFNSTLNKYSESYTEIEIENKFPADQPPAAGDFPNELRKLADILRTMFDIEVQAISKYQRFKEFSVSDGFEEYYFIGFDVAAYSAERSLQQKQIVQYFHKIIKDEIVSTGFPKNKEPIKISIGDGALIATSIDWQNISRLLDRIRRAVANSNATDMSRQIQYRTALHHGPVFRFTDLNDMLNLAGQGINKVSRLLDEARVGQTVVSLEAHSRIMESSPMNATQFREIGERTTKHGQKLFLFEYIQA